MEALEGLQLYTKGSIVLDRAIALSFKLEFHFIVLGSRRTPNSNKSKIHVMQLKMSSLKVDYSVS